MIRVHMISRPECKAIHLVSASDKFGRSPPSALDDLKTYRLLLELMDAPDPQIPSLDTPSSDAEADRGSN